jgi:hypothetical protein
MLHDSSGSLKLQVTPGSATCTLADYDNDGDFDLFFGGITSKVMFFKN